MNVSDDSRVTTGIDGLDRALDGGLVPRRSYMVRGVSGTGKTIVGYHFLSAGAVAGERALFVTFEESEEELRANARQMAIDFDDVRVLDLSPSSERFVNQETYSVFGPSEVEGQDVASAIYEAIDDEPPDRVCIDPLSKLRHLSPDDYQFSQMATSLLKYLKEQGTTTLFTSQATSNEGDDDLQYLCDGAMTLSRAPAGRTLTVDKFRGSGFREGVHAVRIDDGGMHVFPKLVPESHSREFFVETVSSSVDALDDLLGGGIERGSVTLVSGPSGVGKSTTGTAFARAAAERGERATVYLFEESEASFRHRSRAIGMPVDDMAEAGTLVLREVEPLASSPQEFAHDVRTEVERNGTEFVMIDGISGYRIALEDETGLRSELRALVRYLQNMGVTVVVTDEVQEVTGSFRASDTNVSHIADNIVFIRYIEFGGEIRKAIGVLKKRSGAFESTLRSFSIGRDGVTLGDPLTDLRGVLTGTPTADDTG